MKKRIVFTMSLLLILLSGGFVVSRTMSQSKIKAYDFHNTITNSTVSEQEMDTEILDIIPLENEDTQLIQQETMQQMAIKHPPNAYAVSSSNDLVTQTGMDVLAEGGNAVDAAIAMCYTLAVVEPYSNGLGGSGGMLIYDSNTDKCFLIDYRACAGSSEKISDYIGVPGMVKGMETIHSIFGTMDMKALIDPSVYYARNGIPVYKHLKNRLDENVGLLDSCPPFFGNDGELLKENDILLQPQLAETLEYIQENGAEGFYKGRIAEDICKKCSLCTADFENYEVYVEQALESSFQGNRIYSANGPFSGLTLLQMLKLAEMENLDDPSIDSNQYLFKLKTITETSLKDRYTKVADPVFYKIDQTSLLSEEHLKELLRNEEVIAEDIEESIETTSISVVDSNGLCVSCTNTLSSFFGSHYMVDGILLNNSVSNFSSSNVNVYGPGKRSRTFTSPTIIVKPDGTVIGIGTPGGNNIPSILFQIINDTLRRGMDFQQAVDKTRTVYKNGSLTIESDDGTSDWLDISKVTENIVWIDKGYAWGSVSVAGYSQASGAFACFDYRRGATMAGIHNP